MESMHYGGLRYGQDCWLLPPPLGEQVASNPKYSPWRSIVYTGLDSLRSKGYPATSVELDASKLKGGYICDTMRVYIGYAQRDAKAEATARTADPSKDDSLPKSVQSRPATAILDRPCLVHGGQQPAIARACNLWI